MEEMAAYKYSKLFSSIVIVCPSPISIIDRGVNDTLKNGKSRVHTCYTALFFSIASFSDITVINI
jgi:hypothetical protein